MELSDTEYQSYINKISRNIFTMAVSKGTDDYDQNIYDTIEMTVDILNIVFPTHDNYVALVLRIKSFERNGITLTINLDAISTHNIFEFEDPKYE